MGRGHHPEWIFRYYRSDAWAARKTAYYRTHPRRCAACSRRGPKARVSLHHRVYSGWVTIDDCPVYVDLRDPRCWGLEPDEWFSPLCFKPCHANVHDIDNSGKFRTLAESTDYYINRTQRRKSRTQRCARLRLVRWLLP